MTRPCDNLKNNKNEFIKKESLPYNGLGCEPQSENQRNWNERQYLDLPKRTKKAMEYDGDSDTNCKWST